MLRKFERACSNNWKQLSSKFAIFLCAVAMTDAAAAEDWITCGIYWIVLILCFVFGN
jgi:hypothetical protein